MGSSFSSESNPNRNHHHHRPHHHPSYYHNTPPPPAPPYFYPSSTPHSTAPPPPPPNTYGYATSNPYPPPTNHYNYQSNNYPPQITPNYYYPGWQNSVNYGNPHMGQGQGQGPPNYGYSYGNGWAPPAPKSQPVYVEHQNAKVIKNDVNVHKGSIKLEVDENCPDYHLISFIFDARFDGSMTIYYFAKEEKESGTFIPQSPRAQVKVPFQEGTGQKFRQPSGTGVELSYYNTEVLGKPSVDGVFPIVIMAEVTSSESSSEDSQRAQITQAVIERKSNGSLEVKVIKQILLVDGDRYEVHELYGIGGSSTQGFNDDDPGKECVICMTEQKDTAVMPCRHLCMCGDCAKELRRQSDKCPICRQPITELIEIKINNTNEQ